MTAIHHQPHEAQREELEQEMPDLPPALDILPAMEEDILQVFRLFVRWMWFFVVVAWCGQLIRFRGDLMTLWSRHPFPYLATSYFVMWSLLWWYLGSMRLRDRLRAWFLPLALFFVVLVPMLAMTFQLALAADTLVRKRLLMGPPFVVALLPLVLIAWRYRLREVMILSLGTLAMDLMLWWWMLDDGLFWELTQWGAYRTTILVLVGLLVNRLVKGQVKQGLALMQRNQQLRHYATSLEALAASRERMRLARELHDTVAHALSASVLQLEGTKALWDKHPEEAREMLESTLSTVREGLTETRRALRALRASPLQELGLAGALRREAQELAARHQLAFEDELEDVSLLAPEEEQALYRTGQEAIRNISRHAQAKKFWCRLYVHSQDVLLEIQDDGVGFDLERALSEKSSDKGWGLIGIQERVRELGGRLRIESQLGGGTHVRVFLPVLERNSSKVL